LRRCRVRLAVAQVRLSGEQVVQGCLHGVVVQVGVVEREVCGVCQASPSGGKGDVQTPSANVSARLGFHAGFSGLLTELLDVGPGERFRAPAPAPARARAAVAAVQVADFPRRPVCSARSRPCPLLCGYGDAGASLVGWHFVLVGPDLTITGPEQLVSPGAVLARSGQGPGPIRPTSSAYRSLATSCTKPRPQT
jgi:hypothetical protein